MEGNFFVQESPVKVEARSKLAKAYVQCQDASETYGKCVEIAHANKVLDKNSCTKERLALRKCIDDQVTLQRQQAKMMESEKAKKQ